MHACLYCKRNGALYKYDTWVVVVRVMYSSLPYALKSIPSQMVHPRLAQ